MQGRRAVGLVRSYRQNSQTGFTLIELLVVMIIGGILAAIALPTFFNRVVSAKQAEAKTYIGTLNRAQQAYAIEHGKFANTVNDLIAIAHETTNYQYTIAVGGNSYAIQHAESKKTNLRPYAGMVALIQSNTLGLTAPMLICEGEQVAVGKAADPVSTGSAIECASGTQALK